MTMITLHLKLVSIYKMLMLMAFIQHMHLQKLQKSGTIAPQWKYRPPIPYNAFIRFTFAGLNDIFCFSLTRFTRAEINLFLPLLGLEEIRFWNCIQATSEEALAVLLIKLSYSNRYWQMMDRFGHSRTWLSIVFNDTMIHLYRRYQKKLAWDSQRLTYKKFSSYAMAIHNFGGGSCFWGFTNGTLNATC